MVKHKLFKVQWKVDDSRLRLNSRVLSGLLSLTTVYPWFLEKKHQGTLASLAGLQQQALSKHFCCKDAKYDFDLAKNAESLYGMQAISTAVYLWSIGIWETVHSLAIWNVGTFWNNVLTCGSRYTLMENQRLTFLTVLDEAAAVFIAFHLKKWIIKSSWLFLYVCCLESHVKLIPWVKHLS